LTFFGDKLEDKKTLALNLNQMIYKRFYQFADFQFLIALPSGTEAAAEELKYEIAGVTGTDMSRWNMVFLSEDQLKVLFGSLYLPLNP
jgi:predicted TPR repeat methyltransferase